jgi:hypothetical protein
MTKYVIMSSYIILKNNARGEIKNPLGKRR